MSLDKAVMYGHQAEIVVALVSAQECLKDTESQTNVLSSHLLENSEADEADVFEMIHSLRLRGYQQETNQPEQDGQLTQHTVACSLSQLECSDESTNCALVTATLQDKKLRDISVLESYRYLRHVDLSHNQLTDLRPLQGLPQLEWLDASHNLLPCLLGFPPPQFLTHVSYSHNKVQALPDLSQFWSLVHLDLSCNLITHIAGLQHLRYLQYLNLSHNLIKRFENLNYSNIKNLTMDHNKIMEFEEGDSVGLKTMVYLKYVNFSHNQLQSLALLKGAYGLRAVEFMNNYIRSPHEMDYLERMMSLESLDMTGNPVTNEQVYRHKVLHVLPSLTTLDGSLVPVEDKVLARDVFRPSELEQAARLHTNLTALQYLNPPSIGPETYPVDEGPLPLILLVGPLASNKNYLVRATAARLPEKLEIGVNHTTRPPLSDGSEEDGKCFYFISDSQFDEMTAKGEFLTTNTVLGWRYGFSQHELAKAAAAHKMCITHMDMIGALALFRSAVRPYLVLVMPRTEQFHLRLLEEKYEAQEGAFICRRGTFHPHHEGEQDRKMENPNDSLSEDLERTQEYFFHSVLESRDSYISLHQNNPGFFRKTVLTDSMDEAEEKLVKFVAEVFASSVNEKPIFHIEDDPVCRAVISNRLLKFKKEILAHQ